MTIIYLAFALSWTYRLYLLSATSMVIVYDGATFQGLAKIIYDGGWVAYFQTGPHNEPVYPFMVVTAMRLAGHLPCCYEKILACMQLAFLATSQILALALLKKLKIHKILIAAAVFYMGMSPALVNAALSHWSEIAALPLVLGFILVCALVYEHKESASTKTMLILGAGIALVSMGLVCVKALFEYILPVCFFPFIWAGFKSLVENNPKTFKNMAVFLLLALFSFYSFIYAYKSINRHYNGHFMMADRGPYIIYGNVVKRSNPISARSFLAGLAFIPGDGVCNKIFSAQECDYWTLEKVDYFGQTKLKQLQKDNVPEAAQDQLLLDLARQEILKRPLQFAALTALEGLKIFFWESTHVGFVRYPPALTRLFNTTLFKNGLRLAMALATFIAFWFSVRYVCITRQPPASILFMVWLIVPFAAFYSLFYIHTRYCFPIAPLYLVLIAFWVQQRFVKT